MIERFRMMRTGLLIVVCFLILFGIIQADDYSDEVSDGYESREDVNSDEDISREDVYKPSDTNEPSNVDGTNDADDLQKYADYDAAIIGESTSETPSSTLRPADPCNDFYRYTCDGVNFHNDNGNNDRKKKESKWDTMWNLIFKPEVNETVPLQLLKTYLTSCLNSSDESADRDTFSNILLKLGFNLQLDDGQWNQTGQFDWINTTKIIFDNGFIHNFLFNVRIASTKSYTRKSMLVLDKGTYHDFYMNRILLARHYNGDEFVEDNYDKLRSHNISEESFEKQHDWKKNYTARFLTDFYNSTFNDTDIDNIYDQVFKDVFDFEQKLIQISKPQPREFEKKLTVKKLSNIAPSIPWLTFIQAILDSLPNAALDDIHYRFPIDSEGFIQRFENLIKNTPESVILNYVAYTIHISYLQYRVTEQGHSRDKEYCFTREPLPFYQIMPAILADSMTLEEKLERKYIQDFLERIKQEFINIVNHEWHWANESTRLQIIQDQQSSSFVVAYEDISEELDQLLHDYDGLAFDDPGFWAIQHQMEKIQLKQEIYARKLYYLISKYKLGNKYGDSKMYQEVNFTSPEYFLTSFKEIYVTPAGLSHYNLKHKPEYVNLAVAGWEFANRIASYYPLDGMRFLIAYGLHPTNIENYNKKKDCFIKQSWGYRNLQNSSSIDGQKIIFFNVGFEIVHNLYRKWLNTTETADQWKLPEDKDKTLDQSFFIHAGLQHCRHDRDLGVPAQYTFQSVGQNFPEFSEAFSCKKGTIMNPEKKCKF